MMLVKIVAPNREILAADNVDEVYVPTSSGIVGILSDYTNYLASLEIGEVRVRTAKDWQTIIINGGFVQVVNNEILILADDAMKPEELVKAEIENAIENAEQKISGKLEAQELIRLEKRLRYEKFKSKFVGL